jgi:SAM-dependent methyltransferase
VYCICFQTRGVDHTDEAMADAAKLHVPGRLRFRGGFREEEDSVRYGAWLIEHMCQHLGLDDLGNTEVLDVGCGFSFTQAILNESLPIQRYVGVEVHRETVEFLRDNVDDPRFEFHYMDIQNDKYNQNGEPFTETTELPLGSRKFDLICLLSVFTHLAPRDYVSMLKVVRRYVKPDGRLFFSLFIDELTEGGHGLMDELARAGGPAAGEIDTFRDLRADQPLDWPVYSEHVARELIEGAGWAILELSQPDVYIQHHVVCAPAGQAPDS